MCIVLPVSINSLNLIHAVTIEISTLTTQTEQILLLTAEVQHPLTTCAEA